MAIQASDARTIGCQQLAESVVSHPSAKDAKGWGTHFMGLERVGIRPQAKLVRE